MSFQTLDFKLYLITDRKLFGSSEEMLTAIEKALKGGVDAVQLREKDLPVRKLLALAYRMRSLTEMYGAKLFINDRVDVAVAVGADGVQLSLMGIPAHAARKASAGRLMIGVSAHSIQEVQKAQAEGTDFLTVGPVYETPSKMAYGRPIGIKMLKEAAAGSVPVFAIGGINTHRAKEVIEQGVFGVAVISAILQADDVQKTTEEFKRNLP